LRRIIRQVIKENWESPEKIKKDIYELCDFCKDMGYNLQTGSSRTLSNVAYAWHQMNGDAHAKIYEACKENRPDLLDILKRVMGTSDFEKTRTYRSL
jgi:uncharacterized protein YpuA (DUF1002 family)